MRGERGDPDEAFLDVLQDQIDGMVTGFVVLAEFTDQDGDQRLYCDTMTGQRTHRTMGLLQFGLAIENRRAADAWSSDDESEG